MPPACRACPVLSSVLMLAAAPAFAQVAPAEAVPVERASADPVTLDTVQVLATRSARPMREVAASVSVVEGDDLDPATADPGLSSRLRAVPGVLARNRHNLAQDEQLSIRGFGTRASFGIRGVRLYVAGIPATIFVPSVASPAKQEQIRSYGARLEIAGERYDDALVASERWTAETSWTTGLGWTSCRHDQKARPSGR